MVAEETATRIYTVDEYLELELTSEDKHEFVDGLSIEIPGESRIANRIAGNIYNALRMGTKGKPFEVYNHEAMLSCIVPS